MKCRHCNYDNPSGAKFCCACGKEISTLCCTNYQCVNYQKPLPIGVSVCPACKRRIGYDDLAIDLGLSVKWASCNFGSEAPEKLGKLVSQPNEEMIKKWGSGWQMPSIPEWIELFKKCDFRITERKGVVGELITGPNGKSIFLPARDFRENVEQPHHWLGGYYVHALNVKDSSQAYIHYFVPDENIVSKLMFVSREAPMSLRLVYSEKKLVDTYKED